MLRVMWEESVKRGKEKEIGRGERREERCEREKKIITGAGDLLTQCGTCQFGSRYQLQGEKKARRPA